MDMKATVVTDQTQLLKVKTILVIFTEQFSLVPYSLFFIFCHGLNL